MFQYEVLKSFNELEMIIYNYIIEHGEQAKLMTIRELAEATHVSTSTIVRFCKKLGCEGYAEFRVKFKMYLREEKKKQPEEDLNEIMYFLHSATAATYREGIERITAIVQEAKQLIFIGIGTSGILGKYGARYFSNLGKFSQHIEDPFFPIHSNLENAVVIALSVSGETQEVITLAERFKRHHCTIVSITNKSGSTLSKLSDFNLSYHVSDRMINGEYNITTQVPVVYLLETIGRMLS